MDYSKFLLQHKQLTARDVVGYLRNNRGRILDKVMRIVRKGTERHPVYYIYMGSSWLETTAKSLEEAQQLRQRLWDEGNTAQP